WSWRTHDSVGCTIATSWRRSGLDRDNTTWRARAPDRRRFAWARIPCHLAVDVAMPRAPSATSRLLPPRDLGARLDAFWRGTGAPPDRLRRFSALPVRRAPRSEPRTTR